MEMLIFRHSEWSHLYNCSELDVDVDSIPFEQRHKFVPEAYALIALCTIYYFLYIPCILSIWKHIHDNVCYKLLFYIGIFDLTILWILGYVHALFSLNGVVFCSNPILNYFLGVCVTAFWTAEGMADLILAFNRCLEVLSPSVSEKLFSGFRVHIWLSFCTLYAICRIIFWGPGLFSSIIFTWSFDPFIGYRPYSNDQFPVPLHVFHNGALIILSPLFYGVFIIGMCIKTRSFGLGQTISGPQKKAFLQAFLISMINFIAASIYMVGYYIVPPQWLITMAQFAWFHVHSFPPVIYLTLNKTIRHDCRIMFKKIFWPKQFQNFNGITVIVQQQKQQNNLPKWGCATK